MKIKTKNRERAPNGGEKKVPGGRTRAQHKLKEKPEKAKNRGSEPSTLRAMKTMASRRERIPKGEGPHWKKTDEQKKR